MAISGSQRALMYALGGVARGGATRGGYVSGNTFIAVGGFHVGTGHTGANEKVLIDSLSTVDVVDATPNTGRFIAQGWTPAVGQDVVITLGSKNNLSRHFAGVVLSKRQIYLAGKPSNVAHEVTAIDYTWLLNRRLVNAKYQTQTVAAIAADLIATFTSGFTVAVDATIGAEVLNEITFTNQDVTSALTQLVKRVGTTWKTDYHRVVRIPGTDAMATAPTALTAAHHSLANFVVTYDVSQMVTRVYVEGGGGTAGASVPIGSTVLPVNETSWYQSGGGTVQSGPQRITYTGKVEGGTGALIGTTVTPTNAPTVSARATSGLSAGAYKWLTTFITASGETLAGPESISLSLGGALAPPSSAPSAVKAFGGSLSAGVYKWKVAFLTAAGETLASVESAPLTMDDVSPPASIGTASNPPGNPGGAMDVNAAYRYKSTFTNGSLETTPGPASNSVTTNANGGHLRMSKDGNSTPPAGFELQFYRTEGGGSTYKKLPGAVDGFELDDASLYYEGFTSGVDGNLGADAPTSSTAIYRSATLNNIPICSNPLCTGRRIYRTAANGSTYKKSGDIANNTTTGPYLDTLADASLGSTELSTATALLASADLTGISIGPPGTTGRKVYRTPHDGASFQLQSTIANNTATALTDTTPDASLGAFPPLTDTSGLVSQTGDVPAGSTSLLVTSTAPFLAGGGWAFIGALALRYTSISGSSLAGLPASGDGALSTSVRYGVEVIAAPMLTGIPPSGAGSVRYTIPKGEDVNLQVQSDDVSAQATLAALIGGDGIQEAFIQDRRLSFTEATARAEAHLALRNQVETSISYTSRDPNTRAGRTVSVNLPAPWNVVGDFIIQRVTTSNFGWPGQQPMFTVEAAPNQFSLADLLRLAVGGS